MTPPGTEAFLTSIFNQVHSYEQLLERGDVGPYLINDLFKTEKRADRVLSKKRFQWLRASAIALESFLKPDEKVFFATQGVHSTLLDILNMGWLVRFMNRRFLVFTSERILMLFLKVDGSTSAVGQIEYGSIKKFRRNLFGGFRIKLESGKTFDLSHVPRRDVKVIMGILDSIGGVNSTKPASHQDLAFLCMKCQDSLEGISHDCPSCGQMYKSRGKAVLASVLFPGLGDIYLGHPIMGTFEIFGAMFLWLIVLIPDPEFPFTLGELVIAMLFFGIFIHGLDGLHTLHMAGKHPRREARPNAIRRYFITAALCNMLIVLGIVYIALPESLNHAGFLAYDEERYEESRSLLTKALFLRESAKTHIYLAFNDEKADQFEAAENHYLKALDMERDNAAYWYYYADMLDTEKRYEEGLVACNSALAISENFTVAWNKQGVLLYQLERWNEAATAFEKTVSLDPEHRTGWQNLAFTYERMGRQEDAQAAQAKATNLNTK